MVTTHAVKHRILPAKDHAPISFPLVCDLSSIIQEISYGQGRKVILGNFCGMFHAINRECDYLSFVHFKNYQFEKKRVVMLICPNIFIFKTCHLLPVAISI